MTSTPGLAGATALLAGLSLLTAACTRTGDTPSAGDTAPAAAAGSAAPSSVTTGEGLTIAFRSRPDPPRSGDNTFEVTVTRPDGTPVSDATVTAVFSMPAMPAMNMPAMRSDASLMHVGNGTYRSTGQLSMGGTWNVVVSASRGAEQLGVKRFSVVAK